MLKTFLGALTPMLTLALCILVGFLLRRTKLLPDNAGKVMAKMETWVFLPALCFYTTMSYCTPEKLSTYAKNLLMSAVAVLLAVLLSCTLIRFFSKPGRADYGVYLYALAFANSGYMGDPLVQSILGGDVALSYYKIFCLPISLAIYTWGISRMIPSDKSARGVRGILRKIANPPTISLLLGMIVGLCGLGAHIPTFALDALDKLRGCMGPVAMLLAGFTIGSYGLGRMLSHKKTYVASLLRLIVIPSFIIAVLYGVKTLLCLIPGFRMDNTFLYFAFFAIGTPLGLNTVVFPEAYGGDAEVGAGMTLISHTLCILTIPLMYAAMTVLFGAPNIV